MAAARRSFCWGNAISRGVPSKTFYQRFFSVSHKLTSDIKYWQLKNRGLIKVSGKDTVKFLQGLTTNNVELFHQDRSMKAMYSMFLNVQGRALFDTIFYKLGNQSESTSFAIECDKSLTAELLKHMKMYKLRSKVDLTEIDELFPWVVFSPASGDVKIDKNLCEGAVAVVKDPRVQDIGIRLILPASMNPSSCFATAKQSEAGEYDKHRAKLGVCEGATEIPSGNAMPLEYNLAYLNGVSFHKGCYIGQELTARAHHTGVIRKRIMPFSLETSTQDIDLESGSPVKTSENKSAGKVCVKHGAHGLAMIRLESLKKGKLFVKDINGNECEISPKTPHWWPTEENQHSRT